MTYFLFFTVDSHVHMKCAQRYRYSQRNQVKQVRGNLNVTRGGHAKLQREYKEIKS